MPGVALLALAALGCSAPAVTDGPGPSPTAHVATVEEVQISDQFWETNSDFAPTNYRYDSVAEITAEAHLIVRGRLVGTREGELEPFSGAAAGGARPVIFGVLAIDEVLKGAPNALVPDTVLVARVGARNQPPGELPQGEVVFFLLNYAQERHALGVGPASDPLDRFYYARPNGYQCVLRNIDGLVRIVDGPEGWEDALGPFPAPLDGQPFDDLLATIRRLVAAP